MAKRIKTLSVDKISLLTGGHDPAVPKAGMAYSILKFFTRENSKEIDKSRKESREIRLNSIIKKLSPNGGQTAPSKEQRLDSIIEKMSKISKGHGKDGKSE